jgi:biotin transport system substrate-specific component
MKISIKDMALISLFTGLTAIGAFISLPIGPVPITMQTLFVLLGGIILGPKLGALSQIIYIILGLVGVPIFAGFSGGLQTILKPSFGFLLGFIFAAYVVGKILEDNSQFKKDSSQLAYGTPKLSPAEHNKLTIYSSQLEKDKKIFSIGKILSATIVGTLVIYIFGLPYMYFILNNVMNLGLSVGAVIKMGSLLFLPGDIVKIITSTFVGAKILPIIINIK